MGEKIKNLYSLLQTGAVFAVLSPQEEILQWQGGDVVNFLNNYNTQDFKKLKDFETASGVFLTQKGKIVSDAFILKFPAHFLLIFPKDFGNQTLRHLDVFLSFSSVEVRQVDSEWCHVALLGAKVDQVLKEMFSENFSSSIALIQTLSWRGADLFLFKSHRLGRDAWELLAPASLQENLAASFTQAGVSRVEKDFLEILRVEAAIPLIGVDMGEDNLVAEVGLDRSATSFNKGCYLGQETTARVNTQGRVHKKLALFRLEKPIETPLPLEIIGREKTVGKITSLIDSPKQKSILGLGLIQSQALESGAELRVSTPVGAIALQVLAPDGAIESA